MHAIVPQEDLSFIAPAADIMKPLTPFLPRIVTL